MPLTKESNVACLKIQRQPASLLLSDQPSVLRVSVTTSQKHPLLLRTRVITSAPSGHPGQFPHLRILNHTHVVLLAMGGKIITGSNDLISLGGIILLTVL